MIGFQELFHFPLQEAFTVSVPAESRNGGSVAARDRAVAPLLLQEALLLVAVALLDL
jgi:hypothetical protein